MPDRNKKPQQELYLKIPYHIFNITKLGLPEKVLLAHIYSYGTKGCYQSNQNLAKMFFVTGRTISTRLAKLKSVGCVLWLHPKGRYRTIWAKSHPEVRSAETLSYMGKGIQKSILLRRNLRGGIEETFAATAKNDCIQVGKNLPHTNNTTIKDTIEKTKATPSPALPKGAPALLAERDKDAQEQIQKFLRNFGKEKKKFQPMSQEEFQQRRVAQLKALSFCSSDSSDKSDLSRKAKSLTTDHQPHKEKN